MTGDPLFSLHYTSSSAEDLGRQRSLSELPSAVPQFFVSLVKLPVLIAAVLGFVIALLVSPRRMVMPFVLLATGLGTFVLIGIAGASVIERYLAVAALALLVFAAVFIGGFTMLRPGTRLRRVWLAGAIALVAFGIVFTATRMNVTRFDNELTLPRRRARRRSTRCCATRRCARGCAAARSRCPTTSSCPDARWIAGLDDHEVVARADPAARDTAARRRPLRDQPLRAVQARADQRERLGARSRCRRPSPRSSRRARSTPPMSPAEAARPGRGWIAAVGALLAGALVLRLVGIAPRPAVRLQRRRERPLRPARDRDVRAHLQPGLLHQPAGLHVPPARSSSSCAGAAREAVGDAYAADRGDGVRARACARARARDGRRRAAGVGRPAAVRPRRRRWSPPRCWPSPSCPSTTRTSRSTTCRRSRRCASRWSGSPACTARNRAPDYALAGAALGVACATKYTAGIVLVSLLAAAAASRGAAAARCRACAAWRWRACSRWPASWSPTRTRCWTSTRSATGLRQQSEASSDGGGKLGLTQESGILYYLETPTWGLGWLPALAALGGRRGPGAARPAAGARARPGAAAVRALHGRCRTASSRAGCCPSTRCCACSRRGRRSRRRAGWRAGRAGRSASWPAVAAGVLLCAQGLVFSVHNDVVLARDDTRQLARDWMVGQRPGRLEGGDRAVRAGPVGDRTRARRRPRPAAARAGTSGRPSRSRVNNDGTIRRGRGRIVSSRTTSARRARSWSAPTSAAATAGS